jgi:toxin YoeB
MNREIIFQKQALKEYTDWKKKDAKVSSRIKQLIEAILEQPFEGIGKPEPLKHQLAGYWSRRITKEHRLVYKVTETTIVVVACKYHY